MVRNKLPIVSLSCYRRSVSTLGRKAQIFAQACSWPLETCQLAAMTVPSYLRGLSLVELAPFDLDALIGPTVAQAQEFVEEIGFGGFRHNRRRTLEIDAFRSWPGRAESI